MLNIYVYSFENMKFNLGLSLEETKHSSWPGSSCAEVKLISVQTSVLQMNQYPVKATMFNSQNCEDMSETAFFVPRWKFMVMLFL